MIIINRMKLTVNSIVKIKVGFSLMFFTLLVLSSCEYDTDKIYDRDVEKNPTAPDIEITELHIGGDTVFVYGSTNFNFSFKSSNQEIIGVGFSVDGADSVFVQSESGQFRYRTGFLSSGNHLLKMDLITHSGSSSIADLLGYEGYLFTKTWIIIVLNNYYSYVNEEVINGYLRLSFPRYKNADFKEYEISRFISNSYEVVGRLTIPEFTDSTYVGEGGSYKIYVNTVSEDILYWGEANINSVLPAPRFYGTSDSGYFISWNRCKYFNAVEKKNNYRIATPERFFVFFPDDAHRPCVRIDENSIVRKIVVKIRVN
jgi:hypothetical protein